MKILKWHKKIKDRWRCQYNEEPREKDLFLAPGIDAMSVVNCAGKIISLTTNRSRRPLFKEEKETVIKAWRKIIDIASRHLEFLEQKMTDFVKVNFKNGNISVLHRSKFELVLCPENIYCFTEIQTLFSHCAALIYPNDKIAYLLGYKDKCKITREEYDRLCKVLGVEE